MAAASEMRCFSVFGVRERDHHAVPATSGLTVVAAETAASGSSSERSITQSARRPVVSTCLRAYRRYQSPANTVNAPERTMMSAPVTAMERYGVPNRGWILLSFG